MRQEQRYPFTLIGICPKCSKHGFLVRRWVRASYCPRRSNVQILEVELKRKEFAKDPKNKEIQSWLNQFGSGISGTRYWGRVRPTRPSLPEMKEQNFYRVVTGKYYYYYFGHYDAKKYRQQMIDYKNDKRKSRPNGRKWCKVSVGRNDHRKDTWPY